MYSIQEIYSEFSQIACGEHPLYSAKDDYLDICKYLKVSPGILDELLLSELGYTGEELLVAFSSFFS